MDKKKNELLPAYAVVGDDVLKRERVMKRLRMRLEELGDLAFNSDRFDAAQIGANEIIAACQTVPFASEKRLVSVKNAEKLKKKDAEEIADYINNPSPTAVLIMTFDSAPKASSIIKAIRALDKNAYIDCASPNKKDLPIQVMQMAKTHGLDMTIGAARALIALIGENTVHIDEELKKFALSKEGQKPSLNEADVKEAVAHITEYKPWDFVDAFSKRDIATCMHMLEHMPSVSPHVLLRQCVSRLRELICVKCMEAEGGDVVGKAASALGLPNNRAFVVKYRREQASRFSLGELTQAICASVETERRMKSGYDPQLTFEKWAIQIMCK